MPSTALFVVDIQVDQAQDPKTEIPHAGRIRKSGETILAKARAAIDTARDAGRQPDLGIVFVQHEEKPEDGSLVNGSAPWKLVLSLRDTDSTEMLVSKNTCKWASFGQFREHPKAFSFRSSHSESIRN